MVRASVSETEGCKFKSCLLNYRDIVQWPEWRSPKPWILVRVQVSLLYRSVAEWVDAGVSNTPAREGVRVRVSPERLKDTDSNNFCFSAQGK